MTWLGRRAATTRGTWLRGQTMMVTYGSSSKQQVNARNGYSWLT
jgi:hypothetical protein